MPSAMSKVAPSQTLWGDESKLFRPVQVEGQDYWITVFFFYLMLPINLVMAVLGAYCDGVFRWYAMMSLYSSKNGLPCYMAITTSWYQLAAALRLKLRCNGSRLNFFGMSHKTFGEQDYWWHGEGVWIWKYDHVRGVMESDQERSKAFGASSVAANEVWPGDIPLFDYGPRWAEIRCAIIEHTTARNLWEGRLGQLKTILCK